MEVQLGTGSYGCTLNWALSQGVLGMKVQLDIELSLIPGCTGMKVQYC